MRVGIWDQNGTAPGLLAVSNESYRLKGKFSVRMADILQQSSKQKCKIVIHPNNIIC